MNIQWKRQVMRLTLAAMLTSMSVVIGIFCKNYLNFGGGLFRITFENLPILLSGILLGPFYGVAVGAASDLLSYIFSAQIYPPNLLVTCGAMAVGLVAGFISRVMIKQRGYAQIIVSGALAHLIGSMILKPIGLYEFYGALVLWRIPMYLVIAPLEITLLCMLYRRKSFRRLMDKTL